MPSRVSKEQLRGLRDNGLSYAEIGRVVGLSREMVRRLADEYGIAPKCKVCGAALDGARTRYCAECRKEKRVENQKRWQKPRLKTFGSRPVVLEAYEYFCDMGLDVVVNAEAGRNDPEIFVNGHGVKCNRAVPLSRGHQVRLWPSEFEWWYLSDGERAYVIPGSAVQKRITYVTVPPSLDGVFYGSRQGSSAHELRCLARRFGLDPDLDRTQGNHAT